MNVARKSIRNLVSRRGLAAVAIVALVLLGATRDARATNNGTAAKVITSAVVACEAMGGTANVDSVLDNMSVNNMTPVITMQCTGGKLDGFTCDGSGDHVKCGSTKTFATGPARSPVGADKKR